MDKQSLIIAYGNTYCHDDGVGFHIVNEIRRRLRFRELEPDEDGLDQLGHSLDAVVLHQLVPELIPTLGQYQMVIFVDAHMGTIPDDVKISPVREELGFHAITHHMSPGMLLAMARQTHHFAPKAHLVSVKGEDFDFGLGLTEPCRKRADVAVKKILELLYPQDEE